MSVVDRSYKQPMKLEEHATLPLAGGILQQGYQCGMIWGAALAAGAQAYRLYGPGPQAEAEAILAAQRLVEIFRTRNKEINCFEITEIEWKPTSRSRLLKSVFKFFIKGGPVGCFRMAARYAPAAFREMNSTFSENHFVAATPPVSCAAMLARRMGADEMHAVMAAGLAGGIGLCGGGCGALGAAIWIISMNCAREGIKSNDFENPRAQAALDDFLKNTDFEFECAKISGRKFESIDEHAEYLRNGGCSKIIEVLAAHT
jgi:hypothetical protein